MFRNLCPPPLYTLPIYVTLRKQVEAAKTAPEKFRRVDAKATLEHIGRLESVIEFLIEERRRKIEQFEHTGTHRILDRIVETERYLDEKLAEARFLVFALQLSVFRRRVSATKIQRAVLTFLYKPNGSIPPISRALLRDMVGNDDGAFGNIGTGDSDGSD